MFNNLLQANFGKKSPKQSKNTSVNFGHGTTSFKFKHISNTRNRSNDDKNYRLYAIDKYISCSR